VNTGFGDRAGVVSDRLSRAGDLRGIQHCVTRILRAVSSPGGRRRAAEPR